MPSIIVKGNYQDKAIRFLPPNTTNLLYWGMYGKDVAFTAKNHKDGSEVATIGTPIYPNTNYATFKGGTNYLKTPVLQTPSLTLIAVFKIDSEVAFNLLSVFNGTGQGGSPSLVRGAGLELRVGTASDGKLDLVANRSVNVNGTDTVSPATMAAGYNAGEWCAVAMTVNNATGLCKVYNLTKNTVGTNSNTKPVSLNTVGFTIGSQITMPTTNEGNVAMAAIYSDSKTDAEINDIYVKMKQYYAKRGITI